MDENEVAHFVYVVKNDGEERHALQTRASGEEMKRATWIVIDLLYNITIVFLSICLIFLFVQGSKLSGDGRLFLIIEYLWALLVYFIFIIIQIFKPLSKANLLQIIKRKKKILLIQQILAFLPILILGLNDYSFDKYLMWFFCFGLFIIITMYLYDFIMKKYSNSSSKLGGKSPAGACL
jgi:hypothetical protein